MNNAELLTCKVRDHASTGCIEFYKTGRYKIVSKLPTAEGWYRITANNSLHLYEDNKDAPEELIRSGSNICGIRHTIYDVDDSDWSILCNGVKKVVLIDESIIYRRSYASFIKSCDVVIRINQAESLHAPATSDRTDIIYKSSVLPGFFASKLRTDQENHTEQLEDVPTVYLSLEAELGKDCMQDVLEEYKTRLTLPAVYKKKVSKIDIMHKLPIGLKVLAWLRYLYPDASNTEIYYLVDTEQLVPSKILREEINNTINLFVNKYGISMMNNSAIYMDNIELVEKSTGINILTKAAIYVLGLEDTSTHTQANCLPIVKVTLLSKEGEQVFGAIRGNMIATPSELGMIVLHDKYRMEVQWNNIKKAKKYVYDGAFWEQIE